jgi:hypothetical protein
MPYERPLKVLIVGGEKSDLLGKLGESIRSMNPDSQVDYIQDRSHLPDAVRSNHYDTIIINGDNKRLNLRVDIKECILEEWN